MLGKGHKDENFPVASRLITARLRPHVLAFYRFARAADDVAYDPVRSGGDKLAYLNRCGAALTGEAGPEPAQDLALSLAECGLAPDHALDLLQAFRRDAVGSAMADWAALMDYCRYSAAPVGRYLLDLHGQRRDLWPASDALCAALQVINHLQDCGSDYRRLNRVYLPLDWLAEAGESSLLQDQASPELRRVLGRCVAFCRPLLRQSQLLVRKISRFRLRAEAAVIIAVARRLLNRLDYADPLAGPVALSRAETLVALAEGLVRAVVRL